MITKEQRLEAMKGVLASLFAVAAHVEVAGSKKARWIPDEKIVGPIRSFFPSPEEGPKNASRATNRRRAVRISSPAHDRRKRDRS